MSLSWSAEGARARGLPPSRLGFLLIAAIVAVYLPALSGEFLWDDDLHVAANPTIIGPLGLKEIWSTPAANYFPLVLTNFWVQHALWGLNPFGYHAVTIVCHALAAILLWRVLSRLGVPGAWCGAALWALHPVQVESVAWICELKNTQSAIFFLLAIWSWLRWLEAARPGDYVLSLLCALGALLSKPSTVMLPFVLAGCWWWRGAMGWRAAFRLAPFFALSAAAAGWTIWEQRVHSGASGAEWSQTWLERGIIAGHALWFYLGKLAWPHPLSFIYRRWTIDATQPLTYFPLVAATVGLLFLWRGRRGSLRPAFLAAAFFVVLLFPVLGFFNVYFFRYSYVGDHFQYLASIGPLVLLGAGLAWLPRRVYLVAAGVLLFGLGGLSWWQTGIYRNNTALWQTTVTRTPSAVMAWLNLGDVLSWNRRYPASIAAYREALRLRPTDPDGHNDLGCVLTLAGDPAAAVPELEQAIALKPTLAAAHNNLGNALRDLGRDTEAITHYAEAVRLDPHYAGAHNNLGVALAEAGRPGEAIPHFEAALRAKPDAIKTRESLVRALHRHGLELVAAGRWGEAVVAFRRAVQLVPRSAAFQGALAVALVNADRLDEALPVFEAALQIEPGSAELHDNFAQVLRALHRNREAFEHFEAAARLRQQTGISHPSEQRSHYSQR